MAVRSSGNSILHRNWILELESVLIGRQSHMTHRNAVIKRHHNITVVPVMVRLCLSCSTQVCAQEGEHTSYQLAESPGLRSSQAQHFTAYIGPSLLDFEPTCLFCQDLKALILDRVVQ